MKYLMRFEEVNWDKKISKAEKKVGKTNKKLDKHADKLDKRSDKLASLVRKAEKKANKKYSKKSVDQHLKDNEKPIKVDQRKGNTWTNSNAERRGTRF